MLPRQNGRLGPIQHFQLWLKTNKLVVHRAPSSSGREAGCTEAALKVFNRAETGTDVS